ncbi:hypothetical protein [uncultured Clostridium sp.]|uniref:hypothetical protein n=1 Tax=uncultured Clostridium sp. TaxID=59620 RepID=UPI00272BFA46|nr:hypothetical protein [uncultured Clostridium sp.]
MKKEHWTRIIFAIILTLIALIFILNTSSNNITDYLLALVSGYIISKSIMPKEKPILITNKVAIWVFILVPIVIIYAAMPIGAILFYLIGVIISSFLFKKPLPHA